MPPSPHRILPQTSKKARRAYLKANKHFEFTPTQARVSERRLELEKRAKTLQAKEQRKRDNKRRREEKEAAERESKRKRIESGKAPIEALWGKVRASQSRLNAFFAQPKPTDKEHQSESEDEGNFEREYGCKEETGGNKIEQEAQDSVAETEGLEDFFSSPTSTHSTDMAHVLERNTEGDLAYSRAENLVVEAHNINDATPREPQEPQQALVDAQLSLSQGIFDFDIAEDDDAEWMPRDREDNKPLIVEQGDKTNKRLLATPSKRKAEDTNFELASPAKSARSALSEMSPSKVNIRAQEKPDIFSVASFPSKLPTPSPVKRDGGQTADQVLALIATQDLEDDEFLNDKENKDPWQAESTKLSHDADSSVKKRALPRGEMKHDDPVIHNAMDQTQEQSPSYDEDIFDDLGSGLEDDYDEYDSDLDDEALAALAAQSASAHKLALFAIKPAATTAEGVTKAVKDLVTTVPMLRDTHSPKTMPPPPTARSKPGKAVVSRRCQPSLPAKQSNSFCFDDVRDDDLAALAEELDAGDSSAGRHVATKTRSSRTIPWEHPPQLPASQGSDEPLSHGEDAPYG